MTGRPSEFSQKIADEICERLSKGESLRAICAGDDQTAEGYMPHRSTVFRWLDDNETFRDQYARAREAQADHYVDEIIAIADSPNATVNPLTKEPEIRDPQRDRLRVDARKWVAARLAPRKYGDAVQVKHADSEGGRLPTPDLSSLSADQLRALASVKLGGE